jgi:hypothetical protein
MRAQALDCVITSSPGQVALAQDVVEEHVIS